MISKEQEQQVTDYLILHRLPLDILLEVKDHMMSQISDIRINEDMSFHEAFHKTQKLWENEFKITTYSAFYQEGIPVIVKKIVKEKYRDIIRKSVFFGLISFAVNLLLVYFSADQEVYNDLFRLYNSLFVMIPILLWVFNKKMRKYIRRDFKYEGKLFFTMYQQNLGLFIISINVMFQLILREDKHVFRFFRTDTSVPVFPLMITLILPYILHIIVIFVLINFFKHKKTLANMQDFLNISAE